MKGHNNPEDVKNLNEKELSTLINAVQRSLPYEEIIISRAFIADQITISLLNKADRVYISALNYPPSIERLKRTGNIISNYEDKKDIKLKKRLFFV